jgi:hypothetical protein
VTDRAKRWIALSAVVLIAACGPAQSPTPSDTLRGTDSMRDFDDYVVYVSALTTDQLTPDIAGEYGIVRSPNRAMLTISVHKKQQNGLPFAVETEISSTAVNLTGQLKTVLLREIREGDAIYYIGEADVNSGETLLYTIDVTPNGETDALSLKYQKQFFVDG